jgi:hypothetical protein
MRKRTCASWRNAPNDGDRPAWFSLQALVDLGANANARLMDSCEELASFLRHTDFTPAVCMPAARFENCTPLHCAALRSFPQDIEWLLQNGSDPNAVTTLGERPQVCLLTAGALPSACDAFSNGARADRPRHAGGGTSTRDPCVRACRTGCRCASEGRSASA